MFDFKFDWDDSINLGIPEIDRQHQELFKIGRKIEQFLLTQCLEGTSEDFLKIVCELREYITYHFYEEESQINKINPCCLKEHKIQHENFIKEINAINCILLVENPNQVLSSIKKLLQKWLFDHILIEDMIALKINKYK